MGPVGGDVKGATAAGLELLSWLGEDLDYDTVDRMPVVYKNGLVLPGPARSCGSMPGKETAKNARSEACGSKGPEAGEGEGSARRDPAKGSGASRSAALVLGQRDLTEWTRNDLLGAVAEYPDTVLRFAPSAVWLYCWIRPILGLKDRAMMVTRYPYNREIRIETWCWWDVGIWIGPRHTNFGSGSVCSFEESHGTWNRTKPLWRLLDLTTVWVVRHLHLRYLGRWPGKQILHTAHERLFESQLDEFCGCGSDTRYRFCCWEADRSMSVVQRIREFRSKWRGLSRRPAPEVLKAVGVHRD